MKLLELHKILDVHVTRHQDDADPYRLDQDVMIAISSPSIGPCAMVSINNASFGFDWENGKFILNPAKPLVVKSEKEAVWDMAFDHIYSLSLRVSHKGNPTSEAKWAQEVLRRAKELD